MRIAGWQKNSCIDYPGRLSCVLFFTGCNFKCPYCHNPELVRGEFPDPHEMTEILAFLAQRKGFLDGVVVSGGEPTLHAGLFQFCRQIKSLGYAIKLDTNGSRPAVLRRLIQARLVDFIAMDIKTDPDRYAPLIQEKCRTANITASIDAIMASGLPCEFRTTCIKPLVDRDTVVRIARLVQGAPRLVLQRFQPTRVLQPEFFKKNNRQIEAEELNQFQALASAWVKECVLR